MDVENIINFLVDNYVYVAIISGVIIVILIGIIVSGRKKSVKPTNPDMVSVSDVNTESMNTNFEQEIKNPENNINEEVVQEPVVEEQPNPFATPVEEPVAIEEPNVEVPTEEKKEAIDVMDIE